MAVAILRKDDLADVAATQAVSESGEAGMAIWAKTDRNLLFQA
jgi:hypothetical protein